MKQVASLPPMRLFFRKSLLVFLLPVIVILSGFLLFSLDAFGALPPFLAPYPTIGPQEIAPDPAQQGRMPDKAVYQGVVVLTGGEDRISTSLHLLEQTPSLFLLISGVGAHVTLKQILQKNAASSFPAELRHHITLGRQAQSTIGNAEETANWARNGNIHCLLVVTARYHMRRTLMELQQSAPEIRFIAYPVLPQLLNHPLQKPVITLLLREYIKLTGSVIHNVLNIPDYYGKKIINQK